MAGYRTNGIDQRERRRWCFAGCVFDEGNWTLTVDGRRAVVENKPLELLRELLVNVGKLVTKDQLMDRIWPDVEVVEASLPTAVAKLRRALGDDRRDRPIIETVPRLGYRLAVPVDVEQLAESSGALGGARPAQALCTGQRSSFGTRGWVLLGGLAILAVAIAIPIGAGNVSPASDSANARRAYTNAEIKTALRKTDVEAMDEMLAAGWDPNAALDTERNGAINVLLNNCEWDRGHDKRRMLLAVRTLIDSGARVTDRNVWGDTPYSIAKADRYCGPDHPVTQYLHIICNEGPTPYAERCLAHYVRDASGRVIRQEPPQPAK